MKSELIILVSGICFMGCSDKYDSLLEVNSAPRLQLSAQSLTINAGDIEGGKLLLVCEDKEENAMNFRVHDSSNGKVAVYFDGKEIYNSVIPIISDTTIVHVVPLQTGKFQLQFFLQDRLGKLDTSDLLVTSAENRKPVALVQYSNIAKEYTFDASKSSDPDGAIKFYHFEIDGQLIKSSVPIIKHVFYQPGTFVCKVKVEDYAGELSSEIIQNIIVP